MTDTLDSSRPIGWYSRILTLCRSEMRLYSGIVLPAAAFSYIGVIAGYKVSRTISQHLVSEGRREILGGKSLEYVYGHHLGEVAAVASSRLGGFLVSWLVLCFAFAAIANATRELRTGYKPAVEESYAPVRERPLAFLKASLILFVIVVCSLGGTWIGGILLMDAVPNSEPLLPYLLGGIGALLGLWLVGRFAFVVPILVLEQRDVFSAFQKSEILTEPVRGKVILLILESEIATYIAAMTPYWIVAAAPGDLPWPSWTGWILLVLSVAGTGLAQLPMMVGISEIYLDSSEAAAIEVEKLSRAGLAPE